MKAIILSAGIGTRIKEITKDEIPKVMLPIAGKPILEHHINLLKKHGITEFCINLHFKPEHIKNYFGDGSKFGVKITYNYEPELMGTAGALHGFKNILTETFVVFYGDIMNEVNITKFHEFHKSRKSAATLVVHPSDHPEDSDTVELGENDKIKALHHKPGTREFGIITSAACYILEPVVYKYLPKGKSDFVKDVFPKMIAKGEPVYGYNTPEFLKDMGTVERYLKVKARYEDVSK